MADILTRGIARNGRVRVFACDTTALVNVAQVKHGLWPVASAALGRTMSVGCMMGSMLKSENEKITIEINGGGPMGTIMVDAHHDGSVRGFVADPEHHYIYNDTNKLAVGVAVGRDGYLKVIKDMGLKQAFTGQVELQTGEIGDDFAYYFAVSEQTPSAVSVGVLVDTDASVIASGGFIIQMLPDATEEDIVYIENKLNGFPTVSSLIADGKTPKDMIDMIFEDYEELETCELSFSCNCSRERCYRVLGTLPKEDLLAMIEEDHGCDMHCEYCSSTYHFEEKELREIYDYLVIKEKTHA
ncbi:MAG: Hsp33 family molecular chaperone HslO [Erysipelotrichaceae bacterium]|nr:Hsp33 family molecular chaperone HslO [Erysipelotrichaceae bacterium]